MKLIRRIGLSIVCLAFLAEGSLSGQSFDVASIKASPPDAHPETRRWPGGRFTATGVTLRALIQRAWDVQDFQVAGGSKWTDNDRFDIAARARPEDSTNVNLLLQGLLAERFHLKIRQETRATSGYSLVIARKGLKLSPKPNGGATTWSLVRGNLVAGNVSMGMLASDILQKALHRPVVDNTGLDGSYDLKLTWAPDDGDSATIEALPSFFTAVREQLGLELKAHRQQVVVFVIENAEKPSAN